MHTSQDLYTKNYVQVSPILGQIIEFSSFFFPLPLFSFALEKFFTLYFCALVPLYHRAASTSGNR